MITRGKFLLCAEEEDSKHILLKRSEVKKWTEKLICSEGLSKNNNVNTYLKLYDNGIIQSVRCSLHQMLQVKRMGNLENFWREEDPL
jgi:hypothetical protein